MEKCCCPDLIRVAGFIGMNGAIAPEEIDVPGHHLDTHGTDAFPVNTRAQHPLRDRIVQKNFINSIEQISVPDLSGVGIHEKVPTKPFLRDKDGHQGCDYI